MESVNQVSIKQISKNVYEIYGLIDGKFVKRQYIGYSQQQATKLFTESIQRGEI